MLIEQKQETFQVAIIGGGLSGILLAYLLNKNHIHSVVLEAAPRIGGRIQTVQGTGGTPLELGATWLSDAHPRLKNLLSELGLPIFPQHTEGLSLFYDKAFAPPQQFYIPQTDPPSYRIAGGSSSLITKLASLLPHDTIQTSRKIMAISDHGDTVSLQDETGAEVMAEYVAVCIPPKLMAKTILFAPELPDQVTETINSVHTWMAGSTKFVVEYERPFWREKGYSGVLYSHTSIIQEMYDQSSANGERFGFAGFLGGSATLYNQQQRKELVLDQLASCFGDEARNAKYYNDKVWLDKFITPDGTSVERPHQNNGHPYLRSAYMAGKLYFSGTETSHSHPGYMEGAVTAAERTAGSIIKSLTKIL